MRSYDMKNKRDINSKIKEVVIDTIHDRACRYDVSILFEDKKKTKFIKRIENIVRTSFEYQNYISILKNELNYNHCVIIPGINIKELKSSLIEFHHYPLTLFDLVSIEVEKVINSGEKFISPYKIAFTILKLHYSNLVGLVPLSETIHELVHDGQYFINQKYIIGDTWKIYLDKNNIGEELEDKIANMRYLSKEEDKGEKVNGSILELRQLKVTIKDIEKAKKLKRKKKKKEIA